MPPRWLGCIIVLFWLATTGWLFWHELWIRWLPGEPPRYQIDLVDEVQQKGRAPLQARLSWTVERQSKDQEKPYPVFHASTWVEYGQDEGLFTLNASLDARKDPKFHPVNMANQLFTIKLMTSSYRVNRSGQLRSLEAKVKVRFNWEPFHFLRLVGAQPTPFEKGPASDPICLRIWGEVRDRRFFAHCSAAAEPLGKPMQLDLPPVEVSYTGSVLIPLHPLNHIRGLRLGQSWRQPLVDPLHDVFALLPGPSGVRWLNARVLPQPKVLELNGNETSCLVIEYTNDEDKMVGRTWVEQDGERVLQQEAILEDGRWIMKRDLPQRKRLRFQDPRHD